jgi:hypothetical protein
MKKDDCISCGKPDTEVPLLLIQYKGAGYSICPQCLPVLIHAPAKLAKRLPGLETIAPPSHKEHR